MNIYVEGGRTCNGANSLVGDETKFDVSLTSGLSCRCFSSGILNLLSFLRFCDALMTPSGKLFYLYIF